MRRPTVEYAGALVLDLVAAGAALLIGTRTWQVVSVAQPEPRPLLVVPVAGRSVDTAAFALALVALAGVVAVLATRGVGRRVVGAVVALSGVGLVWRATVSLSAMSVDRARSVVAAHETGAVDSSARPTVEVHTVWPALCLVCGLLVLASGLLIAVRGHRWRSMSARYERRASTDLDPEQESARTAATLWNALDEGDDPTAPQ